MTYPAIAITWADIASELALKANLEVAFSTSNTIMFLEDTQHGTINTPLTWDLTIDTTWYVRWTTITVYHNDIVTPNIPWGVQLGGNYTTSTLNFIQFSIDNDWNYVYSISS